MCIIQILNQLIKGSITFLYVFVGKDEIEVFGKWPGNVSLALFIFQLKFLTAELQVIFYQFVVLVDEI